MSEELLAVVAVSKRYRMGVDFRSRLLGWRRALDKTLTVRCPGVVEALV